MVPSALTRIFCAALGAALLLPNLGRSDDSDDLLNELLDTVRNRSDIQISNFSAEVRAQPQSKIFSEYQGQASHAVILSGIAKTDDDKRAVAEVAKLVARSVEVRNEIRVDPNSLPRLAEQVMQSIQATTVSGRYQIWAREDGTNIILEGWTALESDRDLVIKAAEVVKGVTTVVSRVTILPSRPDQELVASVVNILADEPGLAQDDLSVSAHEGIVTLRGNRKSYRDVDSILAKVLMIPGVRDVESEITVSGEHYPKAW